MPKGNPRFSKQLNPTIYMPGFSKLYIWYRMMNVGPLVWESTLFYLVGPAASAPAGCSSDLTLISCPDQSR